MPALAGLKIALLIANGFNENEFTEIQRALLKEGAELKTISPEKTLANGWMDDGWGHYFPVDQHIGDTLASDFDALILPGGARAMTKLAQNPHTRRIVGHFFDAHKPLIAFNEAVSLLAVTDKLEGRTLAADKTDPQLVAANATLADEHIVCDDNLLTAQSDDVNALVSALLSHLTAVETRAAA